MKRSQVSRANGGIRCHECQGLGYLSTDTPLHRLPCDSCMGSGIDADGEFYGPERWIQPPLDLWRRRVDAREVMKAVALCLNDPDHSRASSPTPHLAASSRVEH